VVYDTLYLSFFLSLLLEVCPLAWLMIYALQNRLVFGQTLQEVLDRAITRSDHLVEWVQPAYPVLPTFQSPYALDPRYLAKVGQIDHIVKR